MAKTILKIIPDTSVIIEGLLSRKIEAKELKPKAVIIHEAVLSELEHQANRNRDTGYLGLEEIKKLREIQKKYKFTLEYKGKRPAQFEITFAKSGEIDSMIRRLAFEEKATLLTADKVQALVAESKGIKVMFIEFEVAERKLKLDNYFDNKTMSVHLKESVFPFAKKGVPGKWDFVAVKDKLLTHEELREMSKEIVEEANLRPDGFVEIQRKGSTIIQLGRYRIVITKPPFSDGWEITAVKPIKRLVLKDYKLSDKLKERVGEQAEGILIAGAPGHGKTTFAQAL
ncbi:PIN domain-containing protein, partial [Candidatus Woesearchaeota archaeon]|nr:PIN domain-containing protein [Candidatus Woesearchaeota archaeon]